ncbi:2-hydroxychromene-2-carboxylate isomerase [Pseudomonadota bacterium]
MTDTSIEFYFDFSSPYGYLASTQIDDVGSRHHRKVIWQPYLMGAAFKITGRAPLVNQPVVANYAIHDLQRSARLLEIPFTIPNNFPVATVSACRLYYWIFDQNEALAHQYAQNIYKTYFVDGEDISERTIAIGVAESLGLEGNKLTQAIVSATVKQRLRDETDNALNKQVFGSPFFIVDGEPFWGNDRIAQMETWLENQGW